jgi:hypothetical protein
MKPNDQIMNICIEKTEINRENVLVIVQFNGHIPRLSIRDITTSIRDIANTKEKISKITYMSRLVENRFDEHGPQLDRQCTIWPSACI